MSSQAHEPSGWQRCPVAVQSLQIAPPLPQVVSLLPVAQALPGPLPVQQPSQLTAVQTQSRSIQTRSSAVQSRQTPASPQAVSLVPSWQLAPSQQPSQPWQVPSTQVVQAGHRLGSSVQVHSRHWTVWPQLSPVKVRGFYAGSAGREPCRPASNQTSRSWSVIGLAIRARTLHRSDGVERVWHVRTSKRQL